VGIIFQRPSLDVNLTAEENVRLHATLYGLYPWRPSYALMPRAYRKQVADLASVLAMEKEMFRPMRTFSGGMMRKLEIIRSLIHHPRVLFLDEPTTGLDVASRRGLWEYLGRMRAEGGTTIFLTTHYLAEAEDADSVCILSHGSLVAYGTPSQVKAQLIDSYLLVYADEPERLRSELDSLGVRYAQQPDGRFRLDVESRDTHGLLRAIRTPLTDVQTHRPTLEDAYLEIIERHA
jgi:ABC-2 type transport system ATP-binding protein